MTARNDRALRTCAWQGLLALAATVLAVSAAAAQDIPLPDDSRHSMLRTAMLGLLTPPPLVTEQDAARHCLDLPVEPPDDRLEGPHDGTLTSARCVVRSTEQLAVGWMSARYQWTSEFSGDGRGPVIVTEEEAIVFDTLEPTFRAVWHQRYEVGAHGAWRSITPRVAPVNGGRTLLSVMSCVNGTGGCGQEFLDKHEDGRWFPVEQRWMDQLPEGFVSRILHGVQVDVLALRGEAGFYGDKDPNCCPSQTLVVELALEGDALVLLRHRLTASR